MFKSELFQLLIQVITSWQVIAIAIAIIIYINIVQYAARSYHKPKVKKTGSKMKKTKKNTAAAAADTSDIVSDNDELGLEES